MWFARQRLAEAEATAGALCAFHLHAPVVRSANGFYDGGANARPAGFAIAGLVPAAEALKHPGQ